MNAWIDSLPGPAVVSWIEKNGARARLAYHTDDPHFALWLHYLNRAVKRRIHLDFSDLEDWDYWSAYEGDMSPVEAAVVLLEDLGYSDAYEEEN